MTTPGLIYVALALMVGGLIVVALSKYVEYPLLVRLFFWLGLLAAVAGAVVILARIIIFLDVHLRQMIGA